VPDRVKPSFVIFDIRALFSSHQFSLIVILLLKRCFVIVIDCSHFIHRLVFYLLRSVYYCGLTNCSIQEIFDFECSESDVKNYKWWIDPIWMHRMLYSCTYMATVGVKWLKFRPMLRFNCFQGIEERCTNILRQTPVRLMS